MELKGTGDRHSRHARRGRRTWRGLLLRAAAGTAILVLGVVAGGILVGLFRRAAARPDEHAIVADPAAPAEPATSGRSELPRIAPPDLVAQRKLLAGCMVRIENRGPGGLGSLGSGFVIDPSGLVATNFHVISEATQATASFQDGSEYAIRGYRALHPQWDLAILEIENPPGGLSSAPLQAEHDPEMLAPVVAVGHPQGLSFSPSDGKVSRVVRTSELPASSQQFLAQMVRGNAQHRWIQHTARISGGNSGGPLLNAAGEVIGINTWVDMQSGFSYALHAAHLEQLRQRIGPLEPLEKYARRQARLAAIMARLDADYLQQQQHRAEQFHWQPGSPEQYAVLQELAWAITVANLPGTVSERRGLKRETLERLIAQGDRVVAALREQTWDAPGQMTIVNDFAGPMSRQSLAGVFAFTTVLRVVEGPTGARGALMQIAGTEQTLFVPLDGQLADPPAGTQYLLLGVNYDGRVVRYGDNPLQLTEAPVIATRTILRLDERATP